MKKVFIDGSAGTTGLRIRERLASRTDMEVITLAEEVRKDVNARRDALNAADVAFLCLPDAAAIEAVGLVENTKTVVIDTSTAHRTSDGWAYGFPELAGRRAQIAASTRIANPGCHASGFIALVEPLVRAGLLAPDVSLAATSLTGYSGGGHKHLPEMLKVCGLSTAPAFLPIVVPHHSGMEVVVPVFARDLKGTPDDVRAAYRAAYAEGLVRYVEGGDEGGFLSSAKYAGRDDMEVSVYGNVERIVLVSRFDNLGKGASGAAIQNMNLALGVPETTGLVV